MKGERRKVNNGMKNYLSLVMCLASSSLLAGVVQPLWPEGKIPDFQENQIAAPSQEVQKPGFDRAAHRMPYLEWSEKPANPNGACVILISGGGYGCTCDGPMFRPLEDLLLDNGVTCVWLWYRTPRPEGLHILAGAPKVGKSWLALRLCLCVAKG